MAKKLRSRSSSKSRTGKVRRKVTKRRHKACKCNVCRCKPCSCTKKGRKRTRRKKHIGGHPVNPCADRHVWSPGSVSPGGGQSGLADPWTEAAEVDQFASTSQVSEMNHPYRPSFVGSMMDVGAEREVLEAMQADLTADQRLALFEFLKGVFGEVAVKKREDILRRLVDSLLDLDTLVSTDVKVLKPLLTGLGIKVGPRTWIIEGLKTLAGRGY